MVYNLPLTIKISKESDILDGFPKGRLLHQRGTSYRMIDIIVFERYLHAYAYVSVLRYLVVLVRDIVPGSLSPG